MLFISGNSVFLRHIINEKNKRIMKELVEKVAALYADFSKDANAQIENGNKAAGLALVKDFFGNRKKQMKRIP